jgi:hypothetical protein
MPEIEITPIFACLEFDSMDNARKAWRNLRDTDALTGVSAWTMRTPSPPYHFLVAVLGEKQQQVDLCGEALAASPGAIGNFLIRDWPELRDALLLRRYGLLAKEWERAKSEGKTSVQVHQEASYQSGRAVPLDPNDQRGWDL